MSEATPTGGAREADPSEGITGWFRILIGALFIGVLPIWLMLTALMLQLNEYWSDLGALGITIAGAVAAFWLGLAGVVVLALLLFVRGLGRLASAREAAQRTHLDAVVASDAALPEDAWDVPAGPPVDPHAPVPEPPPEPGLPDLDELDDFTETSMATEEAEW